MRVSDIYAAGIHGINQVRRFLTQTRHRKQQKKRQPDLALRYAGDWAFIDSNTNQKHDMTIGSDFSIMIDHRELPGRIIGLDAEQLVFLDHYGFQLKVFAGHKGPTEIYDESSNRTYPVINLRDVPKLKVEQKKPDDIILHPEDLVDLNQPSSTSKDEDEPSAK